jgi:deoxyribonucleoside regulator
MCNDGVVAGASNSLLVQRAWSAAHLYYVQDRTMEAIASELSTSRSTVSRLLAYARSSGIVDIRITSPTDGPRLLAARVSERHGVHAHVVPMPGGVSEVERLDRVAVAAAHVLHGLVESTFTIGVAWGSTMAAVSRHLIAKPVHDATVVQLNGSGNTHTSGLLYASEILSRFGTAYGADVEQFPVPTFFDDPGTKAAVWRERSTRRILDVQGRMDLVVFSVGSADSPVPSRVYAGGYLDPDDRRTLGEDGVVGDVATVFYRQDGSSDGIALNDRATGPEFDTLRRVPRRCCVVSGVSKESALRGALAAGLVTDLVVDEDTARALADEASFSDME